MNRKGFVLLETIVVIVVTVVSMLGLFLTYSFVFKSLDQGRYYDNMNDVYKLNVFYSLLKENGIPEEETEFLVLTKDNCWSYMGGFCSELMEELNFDYFIYTNGNMDMIIDRNNTAIHNTDTNYLKRLEYNYSYLIGSYKKEGDNNSYYVSLKVGELK